MTATDRVRTIASGVEGRSDTDVRVGTVVEVGTFTRRGVDGHRMRVQWDGRCRTWLAFDGEGSRWERLLAAEGGGR